MQKPQAAEFYTETKKGVVQRIGRSTITQPKTRYSGKKIKWFDDSKLFKVNKTGEKFPTCQERVSP